MTEVKTRNMVWALTSESEAQTLGLRIAVSCCPAVTCLQPLQAGFWVRAELAEAKLVLARSGRSQAMARSRS